MSAPGPSFSCCWFRARKKRSTAFGTTARIETSKVLDVAGCNKGRCYIYVENHGNCQYWYHKQILSQSLQSCWLYLTMIIWSSFIKSAGESITKTCWVHWNKKYLSKRTFWEKTGLAIIYLIISPSMGINESGVEDFGTKKSSKNSTYPFMFGHLLGLYIAPCMERNVLQCNVLA